MYKSHYVHVVQVVYMCVHVEVYIHVACKIKLIIVMCFLFPYVYMIEICTLCGSMCDDNFIYLTLQESGWF